MIGSVITADSISELRAISGKIIQDSFKLNVTDIVKSHTSIGDGGGGNFVWNSSSTKDNNGTVIESTDRSVVVGGIPKELEVNQFSVSSMRAVSMFVTKLEYL
ncbi:hypothetical protein [Candidatus Nitrosocosmicus hydrocola]|uniref:hypothetical protein n=1 Tax=Candidatus Nitrosocosmicus hydrocola TaxID=1826872 RepID=UPI0011E5E840|nr:hypothetical protein [Candidatus Nitrosocosmicus hydrocola]